MAEVKITPSTNGPYLVTGPIEIVDTEGKPFRLPPGKAIALCRCGQSSNKPFCDGTHRKVGFQAETKAPAGD